MDPKNEIPVGSFKCFRLKPTATEKGGRLARVHGNEVIEVQVDGDWRIVNPKQANRLATRILEQLLEQWDDTPTEVLNGPK